MTLPSEPVREPPDDAADATELEESATGTTAVVAETDSVPPPVSDASDRAQPIARILKLVVTLQPDGAAYRAVLALGADGCDPVFRSVSAADLATALDEAPALLADAEERWQVQPRYPAAAKAQPLARRSRVEARPADAGAAGGSPSRPGPSGHAAAPASKSGASGQMGLFG